MVEVEVRPIWNKLLCQDPCQGVKVKTGGKGVNKTNMREQKLPEDVQIRVTVASRSADFENYCNKFSEKPMETPDPDSPSGFEDGQKQ